MSTHGQIVAATVTVTDLDSVAAAWQERFGYVQLAQGNVSPETATSWDAPGEAGSRFKLLTPPKPESAGANSGRAIDFVLRLVESSPWPTGTHPRRTWGWAALELTVRDADALHATLEPDPRFEIIGAPAPLPGLDAIYPMQVAGPAGEVIYLNEVRGDLDNIDLPRARVAVDRAFIVVLGSPDLEASARFYTETLGFEIADRYEIPYRVINHAFDLPAEQTHALITTRVDRRVNVEIDQYPPMATARPSIPGRLPPGIAMISFTVDHLDQHTTAATTAPNRFDDAPYRGHRSAVLHGIAGERIELIER